MKYTVRTTFEGELQWEGEAKSEEQAAEFADEAISKMENTDEYQQCSSFTDQFVEPWKPEVPECPQCKGSHDTYEDMHHCIAVANRSKIPTLLKRIPAKRASTCSIKH
jgi:hypothetical protein